jgi:hypothetical protein
MDQLTLDHSPSRTTCVHTRGSRWHASTIVGQLEIITSTLTLLEERLTMSENRTAEVAKTQRHKIQQQQQQQQQQSQSQQGRRAANSSSGLASPVYEF